MIVVGLESGAERVFRSRDELANAIRRRELGPGCRVYHGASAQWLPITVHPEFRKVELEQTSVVEQKLAVESWDRPLPPLARTQWTFFGMDARERTDESLGGNGGPGTPSATKGHASEGAVSGDTLTPPGRRGAIGRALGYLRPPRKS